MSYSESMTRLNSRQTGGNVQTRKSLYVGNRLEVLLLLRDGWKD
jgi:hypothetical protein